MNARPTHPHDAELDALWNKRDRLSDAEATRLYHVIYEILAPFRPRELAGLPGEHADYISDYMVDKAFRPGKEKKRVHAGYIRVAYTRYLLDQIRKEGTQRKFFEHESPDPDDDSCELTEHRQMANACANTSPDAFELLAEAGWSESRLTAAAKSWLDAQEPWVPVYLAYSFCPDSEKKEPLGRLAQRLGIKSYHHKAVKLGINWGEGKAANAAVPFEETMIGRWVSLDLGLANTPENLEMYRGAFKILCLEALLWGEAQEAQQ